MEKSKLLNPSRLGTISDCWRGCKAHHSLAGAVYTVYDGLGAVGELTTGEKDCRTGTLSEAWSIRIKKRQPSRL